MSRRFQLIELALALIVSLASSDQVQETPAAWASAKSTSLPTSENRFFVFPPSESEPKELPLPNEDQFINRPQFIKLLVERLEEQRTYENNSLPIPDHLSLTLRDGVSNTVSIEFAPDTSTPENAAAWSSIVDLLVDTLAQVIQKAEQQGYNTLFKYSITVDSVQPYFSPGLSPNALKSAAG